MALSLSGTNMAATTNRSTMVSPAQSQVRQTISGLSRMYKALTMVQKGKWQHAANDMNASLSRTGRHKMSAANAFSTVNSSRLVCALPVLDEPVLPLNGPAAFPQIRLVATHSGSAFALNIVSSTPFSDMVCVQAAPPVAAGRTSYSHSAFKPIGTVGGLTSGANNIAALYTAKYGEPEIGSAIALRLYAVSASGLRSNGLVVTAVYLLAAEADALPADDSLQLAA